MDGVKTINKWIFTSMVTRIKSDKMENRDNEGISQDWLVIKDLNKKMKKEELKEASIHSYEQMMEAIQTDKVMEDFERQLKLEEEKLEGCIDSSSIVLSKHGASEQL